MPLAFHFLYTNKSEKELIKVSAPSMYKRQLGHLVTTKALLFYYLASFFFFFDSLYGELRSSFIKSVIHRL